MDTYWQCQDRTCPRRAITDIIDQLVSCNDKHSHDPPKTTECTVEMVKKCGAKQQTTPIPPNYQRSSNIENTWIDINFPIRMWNVYSLEGTCANNMHRGMALQTTEAGWKGEPQYIQSSHPLPVRVGSYRNQADMSDAVSCWRTAREEKKELQKP